MKKYDRIFIMPFPEKSFCYFYFYKNSKVVKAVCISEFEIECFKHKHSLTDMFKPKLLNAMIKGKLGKEIENPIR